MVILRKRITLAALSLTFLFTGCTKHSGGAWDNSKTALHMKDKTGASLWGSEDLIDDKDGVFGALDADFIGLSDEDLQAQFGEVSIPQSSKTPGEEGSGIPGISHFKNPTAILATIFQTLHFNTDDHILRGAGQQAIVAKIAAHLQENPDMYVFIEGHCDRRGPEAYNLALGARRSNHVRTLLVQKGVHPDQIFTISYGKEKPIELSDNTKAWAANRRAQFKIYQR